MLRSTLSRLVLPLLLVVTSPNAPLEAAAVPVRFSEGLTRGFLVLRSDAGGKALAWGEIHQVSRGAAIESRMVFHFVDGSLHDETVVFTQHPDFRLSRYRLQQRGPSFPEEVEVEMERDKAQYRARVRRNGKDDVASGTIDLPPDVYNGMAIILVKNLASGAAETVHMMAFMPKPMQIELELTPAGGQAVTVGGRSLKARHYVLTPKLGAVRGAVAKVLGKSPKDVHVLITADDPPAFVSVDGPLYPTGPMWRIETLSPQAPALRLTP